MTTWLVTGAGGQLGHHVLQVLAETDHQVVAVNRQQLDVTDRAAVDNVLADVRPDVVVNAAAYTAVDAAETDEDRADLVNHVAPRLLAEGLARRGGRLIQVSTDYVFAGDAQRPYEPADPTGPRTAYGRTKLAGERAALAALPDRTTVIRTAWVYGGPSANFVDTMLRLEGERDTLDVVADQIGSPPYVRDLAQCLVALGAAAEQPVGVLHFVNAGQASWFDLARETFRLAGADPDRIKPVGTAAFPRPAPRPAWSVLSTASWTDAGFAAPRAWQDALADRLRTRTP